MADSGFMQDLLIGAVVAFAGNIAMNMIAAPIENSANLAACQAAGGTFNTAGGYCSKGGALISTTTTNPLVAFTEPPWNIIIPVVAGIIITRSLGGGVGAVGTGAGIFLYALSGVH